MYRVAERFLSINGEGAHAGEIAAFIRFTGCNLNCAYCDTRWANLADAPHSNQDCRELCEWVESTGAVNVTLTGGEPLLQEGVGELIDALGSRGFRVEIETNGSVNLEEFAALHCRPVFTMDYKLPESGMECFMEPKNFGLLGIHDSVKFVVGSSSDLIRAKEIIDKYLSNSECHIFFSPVFGKIDPAEIVEFMTENRLVNVRLQLQLHKFIWDPDKRGV